MSNWEKFQKQQKEQANQELGESIDTEGMYMCHFCNAIVMGGKYYPADAVLVYKCADGHTSLVEKMSFM